MNWKPISGETPIDPSGLKVRGVTNRDQLSKLEFQNVAQAIAKYLSSKPTSRTARFDVEWACQVHKAMFCDVWKWAGQFRNSETNIGVHPFQISVEMRNLFDDLAHRRGLGHDPIELGVCLLHHRAVHIHPFPNGNGRWARLVANIWLAMHGLPITEWPVALGQESPIRDEYIQAIIAADSGDSDRLSKLHRRYTIQANPTPQQA